MRFADWTYTDLSVVRDWDPGCCRSGPEGPGWALPLSYTEWLCLRVRSSCCLGRRPHCTPTPGSCAGQRVQGGLVGTPFNL